MFLVELATAISPNIQRLPTFTPVELMLRSALSIAELRELLLRLLSISASLAGFCVAGIGMLSAQPKVGRYAGIADDLLVLAAVCFLLCTYLSVWALRTINERRLQTLTKIIDFIFLAALTLVVVSGIGIAYAMF